MQSEIRHFDCPGCGAQMEYFPQEMKLLCPYCSSDKEIVDDTTRRDKYNLREKLGERERFTPKKIKKSGKCPKCGASNDFTDFLFARRCEYCNTPLVTDYMQEIEPSEILPFKIPEKEAKAIFKDWIGSLWFAPNELKSVVDTQRRLEGVYLPYWLFDADSVTAYSGMRGDAYYEMVNVRKTVNGVERVEQEQVRKIRWTPVSGIVKRDFTDLPISADISIAPSLLQKIEPWDSGSSKGFKDEYISGFEGREYGRGFDVCHDDAVTVMKSVIEMDIRRDIGGDEQRIENMDVRFSDEKFAHKLFPVWTTHFRYKGKDYRYLINGFNGRVSGERPYSYWKIAGLITAILIIISLIAYWDQIKGMFGY